MPHELDAQDKAPSMTATFFAAPFLVAVGLSLAVIPLALVALVAEGGPSALVSAGVFNIFYFLFPALYLAAMLAALYVLTHWPFIPLFRRLQDKPLEQNLIALAAITLYGAVVMVIAWAIMQWNVPYNGYIYDAPAGAALSFVGTSAVLLAARWRRRHPRAAHQDS